MMQDTQDEIFQAFIMALYQQVESLPGTVQQECNKIGENLTVIDTQRLANLHPPLLAAEEETSIWLRIRSNKNTSGQLNRDLRNVTEELNIAEKIEFQVQRGEFKRCLIELLQAKDSVQAAKAKFS